MFLEQRYVTLLSPRLHQFKQKSPTLSNFKCPFCEEGESGRKARGYIYEREGRLLYYCHRCAASMGVPKFIRAVDPALYLEYTRERFVESRGGTLPSLPPLVESPQDRVVTTRGLTRLSALPANHSAVAYARSRALSSEWLDQLFYIDDFFKWADEIVPGKYAAMKRVEPRIIIPFIGRDGAPVGFQGRALDKSGVKYVTVVARESEPFLFGLDRADESRTVIALEGPIDAMFLDNAVASGGGDISREVTRAKLEPTRVIVAYDNERRSGATVKKMLDAARRGLGVCVWPESVREKDINEMVQAGRDPSTLTQIITQSAHFGPRAIATITSWRRA